MRIAFRDRVGEDYLSWQHLAAKGKASVVGDAVRFGAALGVVLAVWNTLIGGTNGSYQAAHLVAEGVYFVAGSVVLTRLHAEVVWRHLHRRFGTLAQRNVG